MEDRDDEEDFQQEKVNLRLHRRDTPHHLKNKRINSEGGDADTLKAILQRVSLPNKIYLCFTETYNVPCNLYNWITRAKNSCLKVVTWCYHVQCNEITFFGAYKSIKLSKIRWTDLLYKKLIRFHYVKHGWMVRVNEPFFVFFAHIVIRESNKLSWTSKPLVCLSWTQKYTQKVFVCKFFIRNLMSFWIAKGPAKAIWTQGERDRK